jgi:hypothetical protein
MRPVLVRVGWALIPLVIFGAVSDASGPGRHRLVVLALGVVFAAFFACRTGGEEVSRRALAKASSGRTESAGIPRAATGEHDVVSPPPGL